MRVLRQQHHAHALFMCRGTLDNGGGHDLEGKNYITWTVLSMSLLCFWVWEHFNCIAVYAGSESKHILICVPKMNKGLTGLERHEGE